MQCAHGGMCIPSALGAVAFENFCHSIGVLSQMFQWHGTVFDKAHGFAVALQAHHDVESCFAHLPQVFLRRVVDHFYDTIG